MVAGSYTSAAMALTQPNGTRLIPVVTPARACNQGGNAQACVDMEEGGRTFDVQQTGFLEPETFDPKCNLTFELINRGGVFQNVFGWYNVQRDAAGNPIRPEKHYVFLDCNDNAGTVTTLNLADPEWAGRYTGGEIGFFLATPEDPESHWNTLPGNCPVFDAEGDIESGVGYIYYSQRALNPDNVGDASYIHLITWQSETYADSFYFGWEDRYGGGDDDFEDVLTRVSGITCVGSGEACETGELGACADGRLQCRNGVLQCIPVQGPSEETCNAVDDDCDGQIDDGDLCDEGFVCDRGTCVPRCGSGEFRCQFGLQCNARGVCVDPRCVDVECPSGEVCVAGECIDACDGVVCPYGHECRAGACIDMCAGVECDEGYSCQLGVCVNCGCTGCGDDSGLICGSGNVCIPEVCEAMSCSDGQHCVEQGGNGVCVSNCEGAQCPPGQTCNAETGTCQGEIIRPGSGGTTGNPDGGTGTGGVVIGTGGTGNASGSGSGADGQGASSGGDGDGDGDDDGCGCRTPGSAPSGGSSAAAMALGLAAWLGLRRRRPVR